MTRLAFASAFFAFTITATRADELETQGVALIEKLGGSGKVDEKLDEGARVYAKFEKATDKILQALAKMPVVGAIEIVDGTGLTEAGFGVLRELPNLQYLNLGKSVIDEKDAAAIGTIRALNELYLGDSKLTDFTIVGLKKLVNLKKLDLLNTPITDKSASILKGFAKLEELNLSGTKFGDAGVLELKSLMKLKLLRVNRTAVTAKGVTAIEEARGKELTVRY